MHETYRVFYDRLVDDKDRTWLLKHVQDACATHIGREFEELMSELSSGGPVNNESMRRCFFGDYMDVDAEPDDRRYAEVSDIPALLGAMEDYLRDHNGMSKRPMNLAVFLFAVEHVSRVCRVLK